MGGDRPGTCDVVQRCSKVADRGMVLADVFDRLQQSRLATIGQLRLERAEPRRPPTTASAKTIVPTSTVAMRLSTGFRRASVLAGAAFSSVRFLQGRG